MTQAAHQNRVVSIYRVDDWNKRTMTLFRRTVKLSRLLLPAASSARNECAIYIASVVSSRHITQRTSSIGHGARPPANGDAHMTVTGNRVRREAGLFF
jgi:hypothetical protein